MKTVETVSSAFGPHYTRLKPGANGTGVVAPSFSMADDLIYLTLVAVAT
jgi:hypothetical protein